MARVHKRYIPLEWEDVQFINRVCDYVVERKFRRDVYGSTGKNVVQKQYSYNHYKSELRSLLTMPDYASADQVGEVLWFMKNMDRMQLLNRRPSLIKNCAELAVILRNYTQLDDALLLACSQIMILHHPDDETRANNIDMIVHALPSKVRTTFSDFAINAMRKETAKRNHSDQSLIPTSETLFSAGTFIAAFGILAHLLKSDNSTTASALLGAAGCYSLGVFGLYREGKLNGWQSMWKQTGDVGTSPSLRGDRSWRRLG